MRSGPDLAEESVERGLRDHGGDETKFDRTVGIECRTASRFVPARILGPFHGNQMGTSVGVETCA